MIPPKSFGGILFYPYGAEQMNRRTDEPTNRRTELKNRRTERKNFFAMGSTGCPYGAEQMNR